MFRILREDFEFGENRDIFGFDLFIIDLEIFKRVIFLIMGITLKERILSVNFEDTFLSVRVKFNNQ